MRHETFYKITIHQNATEYVNNDPNEGEDPNTTHCFNVEHHEVKTMEKVREYLKERYGNTVPTYAYVDDEKTGKMNPVSLVYEYEDGDYSHSPVELWDAMDDVDVFKMTEQTLDPSRLGIEVDA